jgi:hypothetical protein
VGRTPVSAGEEGATPPPPPPEGGPPAPFPVVVEGADAGQARLYLNLGRKDGASEGDVAGLLAAEGVTVGPGDLDVMNTHTYVNVPGPEAERLCTSLSSKQHNGRALLCERARPPRRR